MNCPYCNSPVLLNDVAGNPWYKCGTTKTFRSSSCVDREPLATELRNALARIKRLEEESESRWMLAQSATGSCAEMSSRIKRLEEAGDALAKHHLLVVTTYDKAKAHVADWRNAKEAKP